MSALIMNIGDRRPYMDVFIHSLAFKFDIAQSHLQLYAKLQRICTSNIIGNTAPTVFDCHDMSLEYLRKCS